MPDWRTNLSGLEFLRHGWASVANLSTIFETEFNQTAFPFAAFAGAGPAAKGGLPHRRQTRTISMRIATYNVNGINGRLANLLGWLEEAAPDIVACRS